MPPNGWEQCRGFETTDTGEISHKNIMRVKNLILPAEAASFGGEITPPVPNARISDNLFIVTYTTNSIYFSSFTSRNKSCALILSLRTTGNRVEPFSDNSIAERR